MPVTDSIYGLRRFVWICATRLCGLLFFREPIARWDARHRECPDYEDRSQQGLNTILTGMHSTVLRVRISICRSSYEPRP